MKAAFYTLGCKVNQYESQAMEELFRRRGYEIVPPAQEADLYIVNSCTVTSSGDKKTRQIVRRLRRRTSAGSGGPHRLPAPGLSPTPPRHCPRPTWSLGTRERRAVVDRGARSTSPTGSGWCGVAAP